MSDNEDSDLYRHEALEAIKVSTLGEIVLFTPQIAKILSIFIGIIAAFILLFLYQGSYTKKATVIGELQPKEGIIRVYPPKNGNITQQLAKQGQHVIKGQRLFKISQRLNTDDGEVQSRLISNIDNRKLNLLDSLQRIKEQRSDYIKQWEIQKEQLQRQINTLKQQQETLKKRENLAKKNTQRYRNLLRQGFVSKETYEDKSAELLEIKHRQAGTQQHLADLKVKKSQLFERQSQYLQKLKNDENRFKNDLSRADAELTQLKADQDFWLTAPEKGIVSSILATTGQQTSSSMPVVVLVPEKAKYQALIYVSSAQMGFVRIGQKVWLRYEAFPYQKFGQYSATITNISKVALLGNELSDLLKASNVSGTFYRVIAELDQQSLQAYGQSVDLMAGMRFQADIVQEKRKLYEWILDPLYRITKRW